MADIPSSVPPAAPVPQVQAPQSVLTQIPVRQAPSDLPAPAAGTVTASNPQAQEIRIRTAQGDVVVQSPVPLPPETEVSVKVYIDKNQTLANITVLRQAIVQSQELEKIIPSPAPQPPSPPPALPPLQEGGTVTALLLPEQASVQIEQLAAAVESLKTSGLKNIALPLPQLLIENLLPATDIKLFLKTLSPEQLWHLSDFFQQTGAQPQAAPSTPGIFRQLLSSYLPQIFGGKQAVSAMPESAVPDILDNNLLEIMRAQMHAKTAQQALQSPLAGGGKAAVPPFPLQETLMTLISSMENQPQKMPDFTAMFQRLPQQANDLAPQNMYQLRILKIFPQGTPPEQMQAVLLKIPGTPQLSTVEATTSGGFPIFKTDSNDHFVARMPVNIPVGSRVIFEAVPMAPEQIAREAAPNLLQGFGALPGTTWPALQEMLLALPESPNQPIAQALRNTLPTPTPRLVPTALFFLAALRLGTVDNWLGGNALQALRHSGKKDLAERLAGDFSKLSSQSKEPLADNWRSISMPLLHDDQISQMQFYVRQQYDENRRDKDDGGKPATRFILNLHLSRMGEMQLDGFIQKKNFDIILRTQEKLPFDMRQELMKRFAQGLEQVRMQGGISFQTRQQSWVMPEVKSPKTTEA